MDKEKLAEFLQECIAKRISGDFYPFVIVVNETGHIAGCTIYHSIKQENKNLEIGCTWLHPQYWSAGLNTECKYLMLQHCFEELGTIRVQLKANDNNTRSRKAIEKIGGRFEGILRKDKILEDGAIRNAAYYSIIDDEWPQVKSMLQGTLSGS
jgi:RimJ/RimL family protein N-acetyltransferase